MKTQIQDHGKALMMLLNGDKFNNDIRPCPQMRRNQHDPGGIAIAHI